MSTLTKFPHEYRIPASQEFVRTMKSPHNEDLTTIHAFVRIRDIQSGQIPDKINPRSHEKIDEKKHVPAAIKESLETDPENFHLLNRGCLILAKKAWYDNQSRTLHFVIESEDEHGMVDGATTDRVLASAKKAVSPADFLSLKDEEIPDFFKESYVHLEIISGDIDESLRIKLADARNTSEQVKEFSLADLGGEFDWLKTVLESSELRGRIRYRENEPKPMDIRTVLALLTLFHPNWEADNDPLVAYSGKGRIIDLYKIEEWKTNYKRLKPVAVDILKLYDHLHINFQPQYKKVFGTDGKGAKLGRRKEIRYYPDKRAKTLPLTQQKTQYVIPDGWLYPLLASLRVLLKWPKSGKGDVAWAIDPFEYFDKRGAILVRDVVETSEDRGNNPNATGKCRGLWSGLRTKVELDLLKSKRQD
jgi:hypothetical protein